jgi:hypothetical protein
MSRTTRRGLAVAGAALVLASLGVVMGLQAGAERVARVASSTLRPLEQPDDGYVSSAECRSCHPSEYASWSASYHRTMTQVASPQSVRGNFDDVLLGDEPRYRLKREGDRFFVNIVGRESRRRPIALVTGSHHMQVYWYEMGEGRKLGQLPFAYLLAEQRWVPRGAIFIEPPKDSARQDETGRWSTSCIRCHSTHGQPRVSADGATVDTHVAEHGIACEACHGPGGAHADRNRSPLARYGSHLGGGEASAIVHPGKLDHRRASEICSQCHAMWQHQGNDGLKRWNDHGFAYRPGEDPARSLWLFQPSQAAKDARISKVLKDEPRYAEGQFWSDGMARVSGREYSGMIDSPCFERGELSCLSCHTMHKPANDARPTSEWANDQLGVGMEGDRACLQCHDAYAGEAKLTAHTRHPAASSGSRCYNCHMPNTSYGLMKAMRTHRIDVPTVQATLETGRPNACNLCHLDKSLGWAAAELSARNGSAPPVLDSDQQHVPAALLQGLTGDAGERALIASALGWGPAQQASDRRFMPALLGTLMDDPYDSVRFIAERSLRSLPDVDSRSLDYDFVPRPATREPIAPKVEALGAAALGPADRAQLTAELTRLKPLRDDRAVLLLE